MESKRRIVITGATGTIGRALSTALIARGDEVIVLTRDPVAAKDIVAGAVAYRSWTAEAPGEWVADLEGAHAVVSLAGAPLFTRGRMGLKDLELATRTRVLGARNLVAALREVRRKPSVYVCGSAVGIYGFGPHSDEWVTERTPPGQDHWGKQDIELEYEALLASTLGVRTVLLRTGVVWNRGESMLTQQRRRFLDGHGAIVRPGTQWVPWIHIDDEVGIILKCLDDQSIAGPINASAPNPIQYREFATTLGELIGKPVTRESGDLLMKLFMGVPAEAVLRNRRMKPGRMLEAGYQFKFADARSAMVDLLHASEQVIGARN